MTGQPGQLYKVQKKDIPQAAEVLKAAFQLDPVWNRVFAGEPRAGQKLSFFYETPVRYCLTYGAVYAVSARLEGVAAWVPGRYAALTLWRLIRSGAVLPGLKLGAGLARKLKAATRPLFEDCRQIMKGKPFIYLDIIGVAPEYQGQGCGGKLLRALIESAEQAALPIYLETGTEENVQMYERFGFHVVKQVKLPVIGLPMWEMLRNPGPDIL